MSELRIEPGRSYRAKRPSNSNGLVNDRMVRWMSQDGERLQYDGPAVRFGARFPMVTTVDFQKWAARDVTDELPDGEWQPWNFADRKKNR